MSILSLSVCVLTRRLVFEGQTLSSCFEWMRELIMSHHLVLLPRPLEVHAAVFSALDDRPPAAGCFHVAIHLHS